MRNNYENKLKEINEVLVLKEELANKQENQIEFLNNEVNNLKEELEKVKNC